MSAAWLENMTPKALIGGMVPLTGQDQAGWYWAFLLYTCMLGDSTPARKHAGKLGLGAPLLATYNLVGHIQDTE